MEFTTLLHSVSYSGSCGQAQLTLDEFIDRAAALGFEGVMLMAKRPHLSLLDYGAVERAELRRRIEARHLRAVCIAGYNNFTTDLDHADVPTREIQIHYITELARLAHDLGGSLVRVFTGYESPAASYPAQWNLVVSALKECAQRAAAFGVTIGVQNHHDIAAGFESQKDLIQAVNEPNCRALFDAWAPALHGVDVTAAAREMASLTVHTTIANYQKRPRYRYDSGAVNYLEVPAYMQAVPVEEGMIDYHAFLTALSANGFRGTVAYEMCSPLLGGGNLENLDRYASRFIEFAGRLKAPAHSAASD